MAGRAHQLGEDVGVVLTDLRERGDVLLRDQQDVRRRLRLDVAEPQDRVGLVHDVGRDLPDDDLAEEAVGIEGVAHRGGI